MLFQREVCRLLEEDPELAAGVPVNERSLATRVCEARVVTLPAGAWRPHQHEHRNGSIGFLVLSGVLARRLIADSRPACELLGEGDLLRPWGRAHGEPPEGETITWTVLAETELAVLDARLAERMRRWPHLTEVLLERCATRADTLARHLAILSAHPVERRLLLVLWHLAQRWGRVSPGGVRVPLPLTHGLLAEMIGVRRPSLSTAVGHLVDDGLLARPQGRSGWLLRGAPPGQDGDLDDPGEDGAVAYPQNEGVGAPARTHRFNSLVRSADSPAS
jgi:CRP/FNR family cyclic AMP-dependent transcriptional regulator